MKLKYDDAHHSYWLDGRRCKSVTTVAKIPDDTYSLDQWRKRQVAIGMAISPPLVERAAAHYDDRDQLDRIAEEAMVAAKAHEAAGRGTAAHRITERIDLGQQIVDTPLARAVQAAWTAALVDAGLEIVPEYVERIVLHPERFIAGRIDRFCLRKTDGKFVVVDLKTGDNAVRYPHSIAVQLALYANAPLMAGPLPNGGGTTQHFEPLPNIDRTVGYVVHMPTEAQAEVVEVDIAAGWQIVEQAVFPILDWRARRNLVNQTVSAAVWAPTPRLVTEDGTVEPTKDPPPAPAPVPSSTPDPERVKWVRAWIQAIAKNGGIDHLVRGWPTGVPTTKQGGWTNSDIDQIAALCSQIDATEDAPFWPPDPTVPTPTKQQTRSR